MGDREYNGPKFSAAQRKRLQAEAWELRQTGMTQQQIATQLGVSQPTIFYWLAAQKRRQQP